MKLGLHQSGRMEQRLVQSPQMIQAMQILQLPALELEERIEQELTENPFLELAEPEPDPEPEEQTAAEAGRVEALLEVLERRTADRDLGPPSRSQSARDEDGERALEAMQNTPEKPKTLSEAMMDELAFLDLDERGRKIAEYLIWSLDEKGYLPQPREELARDCGVENATVEELEDVLFAFRDAIHPALGAKDLRECLLLQLDASDLDVPLVRTLIADHLEDITTNRLPRIAKATGRSIEEVKSAIEMIRTLEPAPGAQYGEARSEVIRPDVTVEEIDGNYEVRLNRGRVRDIALNPIYRQMLRQAKKGDGVQEWVKKRVEAARWFIDAVQQRRSTLQRIADAIFVRQRDFLDKGIKALKPLRMQEVADTVKVHISTVSRAVSGKYAETPRGIFPLKFFFTGGTTKDDGEVESQAAIKQRIKELVAQEDPDSPLSDDQIAARLDERDRIHIARRTVTKYRKALAIPASSQRKRF
ncbi:MAG: RNA polymerase factor sigma-54 [Planctomycetes bacterium]|nr:RNA polymerase factor sigma-54 [Planctomycetota bacterium]